MLERKNIRDLMTQIKSLEEDVQISASSRSSENFLKESAISDYEKYVFFSYLPNFEEADLQWLNCDFDSDFGNGIDDEKWWINEGVKAWKQTMADQVASAGNNSLHILLLSGGVDSRAILGGLLENLSPSQLIAATYGVPGAWDFEIAKLIARKYGLRHELFDLTNEKWDVDQLINAASCLRYPISVHQSYVRQKINNHFGTDCIYWSGVMGDVLAGDCLPKIPNTDRREAVRRFVSLYPTHHYKDQCFKDNLIETIVTECPWARLYNRKFTLDQQIDMGVRQNLLTRRISIVEGFNFKTPFLSQTWGNFIVNVPYKWLLDFYIYRKVIKKCYAELSALPCKAAAGMPLSASKTEILFGKAIAKLKRYMACQDASYKNPRTNYINFKEALRHPGRFQDSVYTTLLDLKKREIFSNQEIDHWWHAHLNKHADCTILIMNLSSLELLIKAGLM